MKQVQRISTKALIRDGDKILLVQEPDGKWELPGGKPDFAEHMEGTIKRELTEELGIEAKITGLAGQLDFVTEVTSHDTIYQFVILVFSVEIPHDNFTLSHEHTSFGWFTLPEIEKMGLKPEYIEFFRKIQMQ